MNQDERIAELIKLNTQAFITIDAANKTINDLQSIIYGLLNDFQTLHCDIEENLTELKKG